MENNMWKNEDLVEVFGENYIITPIGELPARATIEPIKVETNIGKIIMGLHDISYPDVPYNYEEYIHIYPRDCGSKRLFKAIKELGVPIVTLTDTGESVHLFCEPLKKNIKEILMAFASLYK